MTFWQEIITQTHPITPDAELIKITDNLVHMIAFKVSLYQF